MEEETALADLYEKIGFEKESATNTANTPSTMAQIFPVDYVHTKVSLKLKKMDFKYVVLGRILIDIVTNIIG